MLKHNTQCESMREWWINLIASDFFSTFFYSSFFCCFINIFSRCWIKTKDVINNMMGV
jgi:hypothetical protein